MNEMDKYIAGFPKETQEALQQVRTTIKKAAPDAEEVISYKMPAYKYHGILVYFAGYKNHIGLYPTASGIKNFQKELSVFKNAKGSVQFPLDKKLPLALIAKIVKLRVKENLQRQKQKADDDFLPLLSAPAKRALENAGIHNLKKLSTFTEAEILKLHGIGYSSIPKLQSALEKERLSFKK